MTKTIKNAFAAPKGLRKDSAAFFNTVMTEYTLDDHHVILLTKACEALDRVEEAREAIKKHGGNSTWDRLAEYLEKESSGKEKFVISRSFDAPLDLMFQTILVLETK